MEEEASHEELEAVSFISSILTSHAAKVVIPLCEERGIEGELFLIAAMKSLARIMIEATASLSDEMAEKVIKESYSASMQATIELRKKMKESENE